MRRGYTRGDWKEKRDEERVREEIGRRQMRDEERV